MANLDVLFDLLCECANILYVRLPWRFAAVD